MHKYHLVSALLAASVLSSQAVVAQTVRHPGVLDKKPSGIEIPQGHDIGDKKSTPLEAKPEVASGGEEVLGNLTSVNFIGNSVISSDALQAIAAPYLNKPLTKTDLASLKYDITTAFYDNGYILVRVVTPPQNIKSGVLNVEIHEARVGHLKINNKSKLREHVVKGISARVESDSVFQERDAETVISDLNDIQNVEATITLSAGEEFKTTDLNVTLSDSEEDTQNITFDTYGSELTGKRVVTGHLEKSNFFGYGETFSTDLRRSDGNLWSTYFAVIVPTGLSNVNFETSYLHSKNEIGDRLASLNSEGKSDIFNLAFSKNLINTRDYKSTVRLGFEARNHKSELGIPIITDTKDAIRQLYLEADYLQSSPDSVYYINGKLIKGIDVLGASDNPRGTIATGGFASRAGGDSEAWIFQSTALANLRVVDNGTLKLFATGQISGDTLLSSDLFVLGGYGSVRGFEPAYETGEEGYSFTAEYSHNLALNDNWNLSAGPFVDGGAVYNNLNVGANDSHIYSTGVGVEVTTDSFNKEETSFRFDWATPIGSYEDTSNIKDDHRFYFRLSQDF